MEYVLSVGGIDVRVKTKDQAVELLRDLTARIPLQRNGDGPKDLSTAIREIFTESNEWRSAQDVLRLIKSRQEVRAADRTYQRVYYTLRKGNFEKTNDGKWRLVG